MEKRIEVIVDGKIFSDLDEDAVIKSLNAYCGIQWNGRISVKHSSKSEVFKIKPHAKLGDLEIDYQDKVAIIHVLMSRGNYNVDVPIVISFEDAERLCKAGDNLCRLSE